MTSRVDRNAKVINGAAVGIPAWGLKASIDGHYTATEWWELLGLVGVLLVVWVTGNAPAPNDQPAPWQPPEREIRQ